MVDVGTRRSPMLGAGALAAGVLSAIGSLMVFATSVWIDPPGWVRIPVVAMFPLGLLAAVPLGLLALEGRGRALGIAGWAAAAVGLTTAGGQKAGCDHAVLRCPPRTATIDKCGSTWSQKHVVASM